ncbi:MAG: DUF1287 domain-containing protein [Akkermansia sp.]|nr:DUF1287 domain-containing protein [Akkermansia sp.]
MKKRFIIILVLFHILLIALIPPAIRYWPFIRQYFPTISYIELPAPADNLAVMARKQIGVTVKYNPAYEKIAYPNGDIPMERGVCTDVVIRAMRLKGIDLQQAVHEDMCKAFSVYPNNWGLKRPDRNIDHRRVPNLQTYFKRRGWNLPVTRRAADYKPGDIVTCRVSSGRPHIMIVSDHASPDGTPMVIHNLGNGTRENPQLFTFELTGHYRPVYR